jgi:nucleotide-binding universal stress UspA family protein
MSVLVATDSSPSSQAAVLLATALARRRGVPLLLMHASNIRLSMFRRCR